MSCSPVSVGVLVGLLKTLQHGFILILLMLYTVIMQFYGQQDPRWARLELGYNTDPYYNIGNFGCLVAAWGNLMLATTGNEGYTPAYTNRWLQDHNGFLPGGGVFIWSVALTMGNVTAAGVTTDINMVNNFLQAEANFAILEVRAGARQHFVLSPWVNKIVDSEDGVVKPMSTYPFVAAHLYTAISLPQPPAPPTSGALDAIVNIRVPLLNARTEPNTSSPAVAQFHAGSAHTTGWTAGQNVTVGGRTDNIWLKSDAGHWFAQSGTDANFGHAPARLTSLQKAHLAASEATGGVMRSISKFTRRKK